MINEERLVNTFLDLGAIDGVHGNELAVAQELLLRLDKLGLEAMMDDAGKSFGGNAGNIRARLPGNIHSAPLLLCAHMDTIQSTKNLKPVRQNGMITSDGSTILGADDRSGIAVILEILHFLVENKLPHGTIEVLFTVCEESGMHGAKYVRRDQFESTYGFIFDCQACPGSYIVEAPAAVSFQAIVNGKLAHAAVSPEKGVHAIQIASKAIDGLKLGRWNQTGMLNIGTIRGGTAINVIPDEVELTGETRNASEQKLDLQIEYIRSSFHRAASELGGTVDLKFTEKYGGYQFAEEDPVVRSARAAIRAAGLEPTPLKYPGGSDANVLNKKGIAMLNLGVGFKNAHSFQEHIAVNDLVKTTEIGVHIVRDTAQESR